MIAAMRLLGQESWQVESGTQLAVDMALYVRDALGLPVDSDPVLPGLDPAVPVSVPDGVDPAAVAAEWSGWWGDVLAWCRADVARDARSAFETLPVADSSPALRHRPALRVALAALTEPAARYQSTLARPGPPSMVVNDLVSELERTLGRPAKPFRLVITEVRVRGATWHRLTAQHVLTSTRFLASEAARPALRDVLASLA